MKNRAEVLDFGIRFFTPAFLGGAPQGKKSIAVIEGGHVDTKEVPYYPADPWGIRIPSLRGVLAFWYRSLLAGLDSKEIFNRQAKIFGSADIGQGLIFQPVGKSRFERNQPLDDDASGLVYLGYGPLQLLKTPEDPYTHASSYNGLQWRDAILPDSEKDPQFRFRARGTTEQIEALRNSLRLLHLFGGLGARSRRGWGSVGVHANFLQSAPSERAFPQWFGETLKSALSAGATPLPPSQDLRLSAFSRDTEIYYTATLPSYKEVLLKFFQCFQQVRFWNTPIGKADVKCEKEDALRKPQDSIQNAPRRLAFGLPYQAKSHPRAPKDWRIDYHGREPSAGESQILRRSSPLLLKVLPVTPNRYIGIALFLRAEFFGEPGVEIGAKGKALTAAFPGYDAVEAFLKHSTWTKLNLPGEITDGHELPS